MSSEESYTQETYAIFCWKLARMFDALVKR